MNTKISALLYLNYFILAVFMGASNLVILQLIVEYGVDIEIAGRVGALKALFTVIPAFGSAYILKVGYKKSMLIGLLGIILANLQIAVFGNIWAIVLLFAIGGLSHTIIKVSVYSTIGLIAPTQRTHTALMNAVEGAYVIGSLVAPLLFAWMLQQHHWRNAFWIIAVGMTIAFILLWKTRLDERAVTARTEETSFVQMGMLLRYPFVWIALGCALLYTALEFSFRTWLPVFNTSVLKLPEAQSILFVSIFAGTIALTRFAVGYLEQYFSWLTVQLAYLIGAMLSTLTVLLLTPISQPGYALVLATIFSGVGFFLGSINPIICSLILSRLQKNWQSSMSGLLVLASQVGIALGTWVIGSLSKHFTIHTAFYFTLLPMMGLLILLVFYNRFSYRFADSSSEQ